MLVWCTPPTRRLLFPLPLSLKSRFVTLKDGCPKISYRSAVPSRLRVQVTPACKTPSPSTSRLASCAPAPVFILTSKCSWTVGRRKGGHHFRAIMCGHQKNQAIIVALKVADDTATCHACLRRRCGLCGQRLESRNSVFRDKIVRNSMHCHTVCSQFILSISAITGMAITFLCPWTALSHYEAMKPCDSDLHSLER